MKEGAGCTLCKHPLNPAEGHTPIFACGLSFPFSSTVQSIWRGSLLWVWMGLSWSSWEMPLRKRHLHGEIHCPSWECIEQGGTRASSSWACCRRPPLQRGDVSAPLPQLDLESKFWNMETTRVWTWACNTSSFARPHWLPCLTSSMVQNAAQRSLPGISKLVWSASCLHYSLGPAPLAPLQPVPPAHTAHLAQPSHRTLRFAPAPAPDRNPSHVSKAK